MPDISWASGRNALLSHAMRPQAPRYEYIIFVDGDVPITDVAAQRFEAFLMEKNPQFAVPNENAFTESVLECSSIIEQGRVKMYPGYLNAFRRDVVPVLLPYQISSGDQQSCGEEVAQAALSAKLQWHLQTGSTRLKALAAQLEILAGGELAVESRCPVMLKESNPSTESIDFDLNSFERTGHVAVGQMYPANVNPKLQFTDLFAGQCEPIPIVREACRALNKVVYTAHDHCAFWRCHPKILK